MVAVAKGLISWGGTSETTDKNVERITNIEEKMDEKADDEDIDELRARLGDLEAEVSKLRERVAELEGSVKKL